jgi:hypothetical protein
MTIHRLIAVSSLTVIGLFFAAPSYALTMADCSSKYQAAKSAGTLNGMTWNQFRKAECAAATDTGTTGSTTKPAQAPANTTTQAPAGAATGANPSKGLTTAQCSAKYQAAKTAGTLNGMKWNDFRKAQCGPGATAAAAQPTGNQATGNQATGKSPNTAAASPKAAASPSANAGGKGLSMADCSAKYQAAKSAGTLNGQKWNDFRKAKCGANAADDETVPSSDEANYSGEPAAPTATAPSGVRFPSSISPKYANESAGKARMQTCLDQYYADKDSNSLGGMKWIQKGGGYYSLCNAKLKG